MDSTFGVAHPCYPHHDSFSNLLHYVVGDIVFAAFVTSWKLFNLFSTCAYSLQVQLEEKINLLLDEAAKLSSEKVTYIPCDFYCYLSFQIVAGFFHETNFFFCWINLYPYR